MTTKRTKNKSKEMDDDYRVEEYGQWNSSPHSWNWKVKLCFSVLPVVVPVLDVIHALT